MKSKYVSPEFELEKFKITQDLLLESQQPTTDPEDIRGDDIEIDGQQ